MVSLPQTKMTNSETNKILRVKQTSGIVQYDWHQRQTLMPVLRRFCSRDQIVDFTGSSPMEGALEALSNIDSVTVTHDETISSVDDTAGALEVHYNITFDGDCVRGNVPVGDLTASCSATATTVLAAVDCR